MNLLSLFTRFFSHDDEVMLDHVPVQRKKGKVNLAAKKLAAARELAAQRHGKSFRCDELKPREQPESDRLKALVEIAAPTAVIVLPADVAVLAQRRTAAGK